MIIGGNTTPLSAREKQILKKNQVGELYQLSSGGYLITKVDYKGFKYQLFINEGAYFDLLYLANDNHNLDFERKRLFQFKYEAEKFIYDLEAYYRKSKEFLTREREMGLVTQDFYDQNISKRKSMLEVHKFVKGGRDYV